jgi:hypothetical protein
LPRIPRKGEVYLNATISVKPAKSTGIVPLISDDMSESLHTPPAMHANNREDAF